MKTFAQTLRKEEGFTLVELAVVMIIIGLLIGGILKGQELITNARITSTIGEMEGISAAYNDFRNQFNAVPGDMNNANVRIANCGAGTANLACTNGNGNGVIGVVVGGAAAGESIGFFGQLLAAGYITGMDGSAAAAAFGITNPTSSVEGGFLVGDTRAAAALVGFTAAEFRPGAYLVHGGIVGNVANGTGTLTGQQAANIDRRLDDGIPSTGSILGDAGALCRTAATNYNQAAGNSSCSIAYRM